RPALLRGCPGEEAEVGGLLRRLPALILLDELLPLPRIESAVRLVVLPQPLLLLRRGRLGLLETPVHHALPLLRHLLIPLVVLPGAALLLGGQLVPGATTFRLRGGGHGQREQRCGDDSLHPFGASSSSVVVRIASKCSS